MGEINQRIAKLFKTQISLTEWMNNVEHESTIDMRAEDNFKAERMRRINEIIELPYDKGVQFAATDLSLENPEFVRYLEDCGDQICGLRLLPNEPGKPKLRMRGLSVRDSFKWFEEQIKAGVSPSDYTAQFKQHAEKAEWSVFFVINDYGISGEVIRARIHHLSQGFYDDIKPSIFHYDWKTWQISPKDAGALEYVKNLVKRLYVPDKEKQKQLADRVGATFTHDYLFGYFETTEAKEVFGLHFEDYSQVIGEMYRDFVVNVDSGDTGGGQRFAERSWCIGWNSTRKSENRAFV